METHEAQPSPAGTEESPRWAALAKTEGHLCLLGIFHYILGAISIPFSLIPLLHVGIGISIMAENEAVPGAVMAIVGGVFVLIGLAKSFCQIAAGQCLRARRGYAFVFVVACVECFFAPLGTVLGVFTIINLTKEEAKTLFGRR